jgi:hypothetical protein
LDGGYGHTYILLNEKQSKANPEFRSSFLNRAEFQVDMTDAVGLRVVRNITLQLLAAQDAPGAKAVYEELKNTSTEAKNIVSLQGN